MHRRLITVLLAIALATSMPVAGFAGSARPYGDSRVVADMENTPGFPEGIAVQGHVAYVATQARFGTALQGDPEVQSYDLRTGALVRRYVFAGEPTQDHGLSGLAFDAAGRLYVLDTQKGVVRLDVVTGEQTLYASAFPDVPPCAGCLPLDKPALPNDIVFDAAGVAYVSDSLQGAIWRVPAGGGTPELWFQPTEFDGAFTTNGLRLDPSREHLYVALTADLSGNGVVYRVPVAAPNALTTFFNYGPTGGPDNLAFGRTGMLYVALATSNQISVLLPDGTEATRFSGPSVVTGVPYDMPSGVAFYRDTLVFNNHSEVLGLALPDRFVIYDIAVNDRGNPLEMPAI